MNPLPAYYKCWKCGFKFSGDAGPRDEGASEPRVCPKCGSAYMTWLNYEEFALGSHKTRKDDSK